MDEIRDIVSNLVDTYEVVKDAEILLPSDGETVGKCPCCGSEVKEKSKSSTSKSFINDSKSLYDLYFIP